MKKEHIVIIGGGYGGLQTALKLVKDHAKVTLIDQQPWHFRKVKLFKATVGTEELKIPFSKVEKYGVRFLQANVSAIDPKTKRIDLVNAEVESLYFDRLVLAVGAQLKQVDQAQGGLSLSSLEQVLQLKQQLKHCLDLAVLTSNHHAQRKLLSIAVVGGGISGIETAAELASWLRSEVSKRSLDLSACSVHLVSSTPRLLLQAPISVSHKLHRQLERIGVQLHLGSKALHHRDDRLTLDNGTFIPAATCVWTLGMQPNPAISAWGVPHDERGKVVVDSQYRVTGWTDVYAIGDCARVIDPVSGVEDGMTCREALNQGQRLAAIIQSDSNDPSDSRDSSALHHQPAIHMFCIALGPGKGFVWGRKWGVDFVLTGKLGAKLRDYTWKLAELL